MGTLGPIVLILLLEVFDMFVFQTLNEVREQTEKWLKEYNEERPHDSLGDMTPREFLLTQNPDVSTYDWS